MPVPTRPRSPGFRVRSETATRSAPASPGCAYAGIGRSGSSRWMRTSVTRGDPTDAVRRAACQAGHVGEYRERLSVPVSWWIISAATVVTLFVITAVPAGLPAGIIVGAVTLLVLLALLLRYGAARVEVDADHLHAGRAVIERVHLGTAEALTGEAARNAFGRDCDPKAYLLLRSYAPGAVR